MITYITGQDPVERGVYACRVPHDHAPGLLADLFLMWFDGRWSHLGSDQRYRGEVLGWAGPLQRRLIAAAPPEGKEP